MALIGGRHLKKLVDQSSDGEYVNRRHRPDYRIVLYMGLIMLLGLIVMYAIGPQRANLLNHAYGSDYSSSYFFIKQLSSVALALGIFFVVSTISYKFWLKNAKNILLLALAACFVLAVAGWTGWGIAQCSLGACRWFDLGVIGSFQPAELLKFGILLFLAIFIGQRVRQGKINDKDETLIPVLILLAVSLFFVVVLQKDLGTGISLIGIVGSMLVVGGIGKKQGLTLLAIVAAIGVLLIIFAPHRMERIVTFFKFDASSTSDADSYHIEHAKIALGTGGLFGVGIGNSVQATGYLPEAINDSVFAIMGETFGFVGLMVVLLLFYGILMRILKIMDHLVDIRLKLLAAGVFGWFGTHVILNVASMIGIFPLTGITLPLLSFGGTSLIFISAALGLIFQLSRYTAHPSRLKEVQYEDIGSRGRFRRTRHSSRRSA